MTNTSIPRILPIAFLVLLASIRGAPADETVRVSSRSDLVRAVASAGPGTTVLLAPGTYRGGIQFSGIRGAKGRPIVIGAQDPDRPPRIEGARSGIQLTDPQHVELRDLVVSGAQGNGINIDDGGSFSTPAQHILLKNLRVENIGPRGNRDGIKLSGVVDFRVESCHVERWGDGGSGIDMVGCHRGTIVASTFRHQGASAAPGANGVQTKGGSRDIRVSRCRFEGAGGRAVNIGGSTGKAYFRPRPEGFEARDITVEDCVFVGSAAPIAFVGVDGAIVRYNTLYRPSRWIVRILQETQDDDFVPCRRGVFTKNIVVYRSSELRTPVNIGSGTDPRSFRFDDNLWFCEDRPAASEGIRRQFPVPVSRGVFGKDPRFLEARKGAFELDASSPAKGFGPRAEVGAKRAPKG